AGRRPVVDDDVGSQHPLGDVDVGRGDALLAGDQVHLLGLGQRRAGGDAFDPHHVGTEASQQPSGEGSRYPAFELEHTNTIEGKGRLVTPGWVDIHTHYDGQVTWDHEVAPSSINGVTSIVMGNCGVGFAPARPDRHDWLIALLEGVEDIPGTALSEGMSWGWESFPDYLDTLDRMRWTIDIGTQVPHAALRTYVMGDA